MIYILCTELSTDFGDELKSVSIKNKWIKSFATKDFLKLYGNEADYLQ
jgi:hypothetical protein